MDTEQPEAEMAKQKQSKDIAGIYISERLQEGLRHISHHTL